MSARTEVIGDATLHLLRMANEEIRYAIKRLDERGMSTETLRWLEQRIHSHLLREVAHAR